MRASNALIPADGIGLVDAYDQLAAQLVAGAITLPELDEDERELLWKSRQFEDSVEHDPEVYAEIAEEWHLAKVANLFLRDALETGCLTGLVRDPRTGQTLQVGREGWIPTRWRESEYVPSGIWSNFIQPDFYDGLGPPGTYVASAAQPVFIWKSEFDPWLAQYSAKSTTAVARGRPKGSGGYQRLDWRFYQEMRKRIASGDAQSVTEAAKKIADQAPGSMVFDSKVSQLVKGYRKYAERLGWQTVPIFPSG